MLYCSRNPKLLPKESRLCTGYDLCTCVMTSTLPLSRQQVGVLHGHRDFSYLWTVDINESPRTVHPYQIASNKSNPSFLSPCTFSPATGTRIGVKVTQVEIVMLGNTSLHRTPRQPGSHYPHIKRTLLKVRGCVSYIG